MHQKAVFLRFRQRVGSLLFDRILCRHDNEEFGKFACLTRDGYLTLLHRFEHHCLYFGRRPVDLVSQYDISKYRAGFESKVPLSVHFVQLLLTGDIGGDQIWCELDTGELRLDDLRHRPHRSCFGQTGKPFDKQVSICQYPDDQAFDDMLLTDNRVIHPLLKQPDQIVGFHSINSRLSASLSICFSCRDLSGISFL